MQEVLSHASGSVMQEYLSMQGVLSSGARVSVMQEDLSHARGSVTQEVLSCKGICLWSSSILGPMQGVLCPICCKRICLMQGVLSCKSICHARGSVPCKGFCLCKRICLLQEVLSMQEVLSCKGFCHLVQEYLSSGASGSTNLLQEDLSLEWFYARVSVMQVVPYPNCNC